jgi:L-lactate dehydrogenase complex protein LldG
LEREKEMSEREAILARIREALTIPAPMPGSHDHDAHSPGELRNFSKWLPAVGATFDEQAALFKANSTELRTDFRLVESQTAATSALAEIGATEGWKKVAIHRAPLVEAAIPPLAISTLAVDGGYDVNELESCDAGITECDALIAQTGTILITSRSAGGRALSVLPPHHVVIARRNQLLPDLPAAFALLKSKYAAAYPSMISLITGPSRTGDIERILVLGAHGPKKLTVLCF